MAKNKLKKNSKSGLSDQLIYCSRLYRAYLTKNLQDYGLFSGQEHLLKALRKKNGQSMGQLAKRLRVRPPTITKMVARMATQELVTKLTSQDDNRLSHVFITQKGLDLYNSIKQSKQLTQKNALNKLSQKEIEQFGKILEKITANLEKLEQTQ